MRRLRILLVDDHEIVRLGVCELLASDPRFRIVGEAATAADAIAETLRLHPDVVVMDLRLDGASGIEATRAIRAASPATEVVIHTTSPAERDYRAALEAGASAYVLKRLGGNDLVDALERVLQGRAALRDAAARLEAVRAGDRKAEDVRLAALNDQELRVLAYIAEGLTNREIALRLELSEGTVRNYSSGLLRKLGLGTRAAAAAYAARHHISDYVPGPPDEERIGRAPGPRAGGG